MDVPAVVGAVVAGMAAGVLSGLFGVGGAVITTPSIRALGVSPIMAVGSTIPAILPAAVTGAHRYAREGLVEWRVAWSCGLAGAVLAVAGAWVSDLVDARWLMVVTAGLLAWSGVSAMAKSRAERVAAARLATADPGPAEVPRHLTDDGTVPGFVDGAGNTPVVVPAVDAGAGGDDVVDGVVRGVVHGAADGAADGPVRGTAGGGAGGVGPGSTSPLWQLAGVGGLAGFVAGLLGVGGGIVMMPLFTGLLRLPVKVAVASSLVAVAVFSVPALVTHAALGHIDWPVALALVVGSIPGAHIGARIAIGTADATLRLWLGSFFCVIAVVYGARELSAIF